MALGRMLYRETIMDFISFIIFVVIAVVVSWVLHYPLKYHVTEGVWSFLSKVVFAYIGAMLGSSFFGEWWPAVAYGGVYFVPAILGAFAILIVIVDVAKTLKGSPGEQ